MWTATTYPWAKHCEECWSARICPLCGLHTKRYEAHVKAKHPEVVKTRGEQAPRYFCVYTKKQVTGDYCTDCNRHDCTVLESELVND